MIGASLKIEQLFVEGIVNSKCLMKVADTIYCRADNIEGLLLLI